MTPCIIEWSLEGTKSWFVPRPYRSYSHNLILILGKTMHIEDIKLEKEIDELVNMVPRLLFLPLDKMKKMREK
jgi:hypothetical protein